MPRAISNKRLFIPKSNARKTEVEVLDFSKGMDTFTSNDTLPNRVLRLAQNARIDTTSGEYETRRGVDAYSDLQTTPDVTFINDDTTSLPADHTFSDTTYLAAKLQSVGDQSIYQADLRLKDAASATGDVFAELWSDSGGSPGTVLASTSIAGSTVTGSYGYLSFYFVLPYLAGSGVTLWLVARVQSPATNSYSWSSSEPVGLTNAKISTNSGSTWSNLTGKTMNFKVYRLNTPRSVHGLHRAHKSDGTKKTLFTYHTNLAKVDDSDGSVTLIKSNLSGSATATRFVNVNDIVYYVNGVDGIRKWDFTNESQVDATDASIVVEHKAFLFFNDVSDPNKVFWSNFADYETFTATDFIYVPSPKTGDPVTAMVSLNGALMIFTRNRKYVLYGTDTATFELQEAAGKKGTFTQESVATDKNYAYFVSDDGIYRTNGTVDELISGPIYNDIRDNTNKDIMVLCVNRGRLYVFCPSSSGTYNDVCYVFNLTTGIVESLDTKTYVSRAVTGYLDDDKMYVGSSVIEQVHIQELPTNDFNSLGGPIDFELRTGFMPFGKPSVPKQLRKWRPRFLAQTGNYTITLQYAVDLIDTATTQTTVSVVASGSVAEVQGDTNVPGSYRRIQLRYRHTGARQPHRLLGHTLVALAKALR